MADAAPVYDEGDPLGIAANSTRALEKALTSEFEKGQSEAIARSQRFFAQLALEARKPSFGEQASGWTRSLLIRAEEAGLFDPTLENV